MFRLIMSSIKYSRKNTLIFFLALVIILVMFPILLSSMRQSTTIINQNIEKYSRGSYDILVRPKDSANLIEKKLSLVEENYSHYYKTGISLDEWKQIKTNKDIEIAAPIASIGYFTGSTKSFSVPFPNYSTKFTLQFYTSDGINIHRLSQDQVVYYLKSDKGEADTVVNNPELINPNQPETPPSFLIPNTYHFVVAIDPESEKKLTGINFDPLLYNSKPPNSIAGVDKNTQMINIMKNENTMQPLTAKITTEKINNVDMKKIKEEHKINSFAEYSNNQTGYKDLIKMLNTHLSSKKLLYETDFSKVLSPFEYKPIFISPDGIAKEGEKISFFMDSRMSTKYYRLSNIDYHLNNEKDLINVTRRGYENNVPIYRDLESKSGPMWALERIPYLLNIVGSFNIKENQNQLASSPLGIYNISQSFKDEQRMYPTIFPGSFIASPAEGIMNIKFAELLKNEQPINAIRIKVKGIKKYDEAAREKIKKVANELALKGYRVDIVAGASIKKVKLDVEDLGEVTENWTSLGAAVKILKNWNKTSIILSFSFFILSLIFIINRFYFRSISSRDLIETLTILNWEQNKVRKMFSLEWLILNVSAWILSTILLIIIYLFVLKDTKIFIFENVFFILIIIISLLNIRLIVSDHLFTYDFHTKLKKVYLQNLIYYRKLIFPSFIQLVVTSFSIVYVGLQIFLTFLQNSDTTLGNFTNNSVKGIQISIIISMVMITIFTLFDYLLALLIIRKNEIKTLFAIGWELKHISNLMTKESLYWSFIATLIGSISSVSFFIYINQTFNGWFLLFVLNCFVITFIVILIVRMILNFYLKRIP
jgi:putative ABC transport system permease protein